MSDMPDRRMGSHAGPRGPIDEGVDRDLKALAARSHRNMKSLTDTIDGLAGGRPDGRAGGPAEVDSPVRRPRLVVEDAPRAEQRDDFSVDRPAEAVLPKVPG